MDEFVLVGVSELLRRVVLDLGEDDGGETGGGGSGGGGVLGEDGVLVGDAGVEERSCWYGGRRHCAGWAGRVFSRMSIASINSDRCVAIAVCCSLGFGSLLDVVVVVRDKASERRSLEDGRWVRQQ